MSVDARHDGGPAGGARADPRRRRRPRERAARIAGRRVLLVGTGTSWHAANQGAHMLRRAGLDAWPLTAADAAAGDPRPGAGDALILLSHRGTKRFTSEVLGEARERGVPTVLISHQGNPEADLDTVPNEVSSAFTASHLGALLRLAQLAERAGAPLGALAAVPAAVAEELARGPDGSRAAVAAARVHRLRDQRLDGRGGSAQDPRDRARRERGPRRRDPAARARGRARRRRRARLPRRRRAARPPRRARRRDRGARHADPPLRARRARPGRSRCSR